MKEVPDGSIDLVVTSPPYPMIEMWDEVFTSQNAGIGRALRTGDGPLACELMHRELDRVWDELFRVLTRGGIACVNIGDATRTIADRFALYTNHSRIHSRLQEIGFSALPAIIWRKQTNAPNKFMGSGMMPPGAYVTLEHEYVLVLRKGNRKEFKTEEQKKRRHESAYFWEERNAWFSDVWMDLKGASQNLYDGKTRNRSGAYPFELPYRLITMFSVKGDTVLDPFLGLGTTMWAAMAAGRNSIGYEIDRGLATNIEARVGAITGFANRRIRQRLEHHLEFVENRIRNAGGFKYTNKHYRFPVITRQEVDLVLNDLSTVEQVDRTSFEVQYSKAPQEAYVRPWEACLPSNADSKFGSNRRVGKQQGGRHRQRRLFSSR
jgi:DNA modification methylase